MILDDLYFDNREKAKLPPAYREIQRQMKPYDEQIKQVFGLRFLDEYTELWAQCSGLMERYYFRSGAQFAVRFLLEGLLYTKTD